ncbi:MAG: hypothetical protein EBU46_01750 [Nitrosomonadaceae bacterium]|nr:hypothetical protein [Nitrosomonadaceae bacterium]
MKAKFLDNAPQILIQSLEIRHRLTSNLTSNVQNQVVDYMLEHITNIEACSEEQKREIRARCHEIFVLFPLKEQIEVLEKLITNPGMKKVWNKLSKEVKDDYEYEQFWQACIEAKAGGVRDFQRTKKEHEKHFQQIKECALELSRLLEETNEMFYFPITRLISDGKIDRLRAKLHAPPEASTQHVRSYLDGVIPDIQAVLHDLAVQAEKISKTAQLTKKPNSKSGEKTKGADVQYFVRYLSRYLKKFEQPLHEVVAATARVVFDDINIDAEYVRQLNR